jgi:hypothetical protein
VTPLKDPDAPAAGPVDAPGPLGMRLIPRTATRTALAARNRGCPQTAAVAPPIPLTPLPTSAKRIAQSGTGGDVLPDGTTVIEDGLATSDCRKGLRRSGWGRDATERYQVRLGLCVGISVSMMRVLGRARPGIRPYPTLGNRTPGSGSCLTQAVRSPLGTADGFGSDRDRNHTAPTASFPGWNAGEVR